MTQTVSSIGRCANRSGRSTKLIRQASRALSGSIFVVLTLPAFAQSPPPSQVVFRVQLVQANLAARTALAAVRVNATPDFHADGMNLHLLRPDAALSSLLARQRALRALEELSGPQLRTPPGKAAYFLIGGRYPIPVRVIPPRPGVPAPPGPPPSIGSRDFGIHLSFQPFPQPGGRLRVRVHPLVRTVDFSRTTTRGILIVPGINSVQMKTDVEVVPGGNWPLSTSVAAKRRKSRT